MIKNNPYTSNTFVEIWSKHFIKSQINYAFDFITGIKFYKPTILPIYINIGRNLTKGVSYSISLKNEIKDFKKKVLLIYDVPQYFKIDNSLLRNKIKCIKVKQYPGYITNLENYKDYDDYIATNFSRKSKYKFKSYIRTLENTFNISYKHFYGEVNKNDYETIFNQFYGLLKKRFHDKSEINNNLSPNEWEFYKESVYPLILEKKASLFVVYQDSNPIAISLNYFSDDILFFAITGFDIDYAKYNVGKVHLMELFKWCFEKNIKVFDFSKGYYDYKERWSDIKYHFENHIYYNSNSFFSMTIAHFISSFFKLKQYMRDKNLNKKFNKIISLIRN